MEKTITDASNEHITKVQQYLEQGMKLGSRIKIAGDIRRQLYLDMDSLKSMENAPGLSDTMAERLKQEWRTLSEKLEQANKRLLDLIMFRAQLSDVITAIPNTDERLILRYRYMDELPWSEIATKLYISRRTGWRWCQEAMQHIKLPEDAIWLGS